ncbi:MAG: hypothetical protein A2Y61_03350 [Chloroflexi bacterium RBG_13_60_13]|nr:MAG: hypothetical protein A2Y61_03350 [Chloroflexi bacterium RBG_13_60_13]
MALTLLTVTEPLWTGAAVASVFVCHLLGHGPSYPWIGLGVASLTVPLRLINHTTSRLPTRFDLPLTLLMIGALIGLLTSPNRTISLGAFQCMLALSLLYYSWVNYSRLSGLMKCIILLAPAAMLVSLLLAIFDLPSPSTQPGFDFGGVGTHHGLALALVILIAVLAGIAVFSAQPRTRLIAGITCLSFIIITFVLIWDSLQSLLAWDSITGRLPIWGDTLQMLADAPIAGLGLGCWALTYYGATAITSEITHAHNAYLELYSNTGILGAIAFVVFLAIGLKLAWDIIRSPRDNPWYGFGVGVVLACAATLLVGVVESAPVGVPLVASDTYYYLISPVPWILAGLLVIARRLQTAQPSL